MSMTSATRPTRQPYVSVIGGYDVAPEVLAAAEEVGRGLASSGAVVVTGGRGGVSEAASKGAFEAGGTTIGILPGTDRSEANPYLTVAVCTGIGLTRNALVAMNGDVVIALDGAFGTLSELAHALLAGTPVVGFGTWRLDREPDSDRVEAEDPIVRVPTPAAAVEAALRAVGG
ncbi:MAG: TIGR00725 family protein [Acidimicrobiales bacterium]